MVGSVNADMVLQVERLPADGETLAAESLETFPGGKVSLPLSEQAAKASRLDRNTFFERIEMNDCSKAHSELWALPLVCIVNGF